MSTQRQTTSDKGDGSMQREKTQLLLRAHLSLCQLSHQPISPCRSHRFAAATRGHLCLHRLPRRGRCTHLNPILLGFPGLWNKVRCAHARHEFLRRPPPIPVGVCLFFPAIFASSKGLALSPWGKGTRVDLISEGVRAVTMHRILTHILV